MVPERVLNIIVKKHFYLILIILVLFIWNPLDAQELDNQTRSSFSFSADFFQIKESLNQGLVFRGPQFSFGYSFEKPVKNRLLLYKNRVSTGPGFSHGMLGATFNVKPAEIFYGFKTRSEKIQYFFGPTFKMEYNFQVYPDLQSGFTFWYTDYHIGLGNLLEFPFRKHIVRLTLSNSLFGVISRPEPYRDPYFFSLKFRDIASSMHQDFRFGSFKVFNNTSLEVELLPVKISPRFTVCYLLEYFGYYKSPKLTSLNQSVMFKLYRKHKKND